jgi:hypothetical protein
MEAVSDVGTASGKIAEIPGHILLLLSLAH